ncbi:MAG: YbbR-like domain-containing protein [Bacteroidota bacterium]|nr:YbbR-like domain-containing protein [Bacteroidota bacterium]MDP3145730.1 YbbR-like domain-containing protein [Bacteroidota bacterium]MDP3556861.1 YbbR-like domain-containing protein [Bacteroidota bacterium]
MNNSNTSYSEKKRKPGKATAFFICVAIACLLWILQALNTVYNYNLIVPVTFKNLPQNKIALTQLPDKISVDVKASGLKLLLVLANKPFKPVEIDFNTLKLTNKQQNYILTGSGLNFKGSFKFETQIKRISPDTLYFSEKNGYQKNVPVKVPLYLKCTQGFAFNHPEISPSFITIYGDKSVINKIDTMYTQPLNLININQSYKGNLVIIKPNSFVSTSAAEVLITIEVNKLIEHTIQLPITALNSDNFKQITIFPSKVNVKFTSMQNQFSISDTSLFRANINPLKINSNNKCSVVLSTVPGNVNIIGLEPKEVEILIIKK